MWRRDDRTCASHFVLSDLDSSDATIARSTHSVVVTPAASATASRRKRRFIGNRHVTAMRGDVRTGLPAFFCTGGDLLRRCNHALPDAEAKPDVFQDEEQRIGENFLTVLRRLEDRRAERKSEVLEVQPVNVGVQLLDRGVIEALA